MYRGATGDDFIKIAGFFDRAVDITNDIHEEVKANGGKMKEFRAALADADKAYAKYPKLAALANEVKAFSQTFPTIAVSHI